VAAASPVVGQTRFVRDDAKDDTKDDAGDEDAVATATRVAVPPMSAPSSSRGGTEPVTVLLVSGGPGFAGSP
jgi:hypothetical protein